MKKIPVWVLITFLLFFAVAIFSTYKIADYIGQANARDKLKNDISSAAVTVSTPAPTPTPTPTPEATEETPEPTETPEVPETAPVEVDFEYLHQNVNKDIVAWIYCADTAINYAVTQGDDNDYYLHRLLDGSYNYGGTLFIDYRNPSDFTGWNTFLYGHNMKDGSMFGSVTMYNEQWYYDAHPVWYLLTPEKNFKFEPIGGFVVPGDSEIYNLNSFEFNYTKEQRDALIQVAQMNSTFSTGNNVTINDDDKLLTLSTCDYEFDDARYLLIGVLHEIAK